MTSYIDEHKVSYGIEPICRTLAIAPSSYYAAKTRPASARAVRDAELSTDITRIHADHFSVYGVRKAWRVLRREGTVVGRDRVGRLMRGLGLAGATRTKRIRTTKPAPVSQRPADLVERVFSAVAPNRLWVADLTYVWTRTGFVYTAFVVDVFSRAIVGWRVAASLHTELALDALEMAIWNRRSADLGGLVHHSDRGVQGGFKGSSQPLHQGGGHGTTTGMDPDGDRQGSTALAGASVTASRDRAWVLETDRDGCRERGRRDGNGCVAARRHPVVPSGWRHVTDPSGRAVRPFPVVR